MITLDDLVRILSNTNVTINVTIGQVQINCRSQSDWQIVAPAPPPNGEGRPAEAAPLPLAAPRYSVAPPDEDFEESYRQMQRNRAAWIDAEFARLVPPGVT